MALSTYTELKAALADYLHRTDMTSRIVDFITLAEAEINTDLRMRLMETDATLTLTSGASTTALPARYSEPIFLELVISGRENTRLKYLTPGQMPTQTGTGEPREWTINGANIEVPYDTDQAYSLRFRHLADFDIATTSTNALLTKYPNIYLYASMLQAALFTEDDTKIQKWSAMYESLKKKAIRKEGRTRTLATLQTEFPLNRNTSTIIQG